MHLIFPDTTCPTHLVTLTTFGENDKVETFSLHNFLHLPDVSPFSDTDILLKTSFTEIPNPWHSLKKEKHHTSIGRKNKSSYHRFACTHLNILKTWDTGHGPLQACQTKSLKIKINTGLRRTGKW
jgi:hypothetical protein